MVTDAEDMATQYLKDSEKVFMDSLNYVNAHTSQVANNIESISKDVGYDISEYISNAWKGAGNAVDTYENILQGRVPLITGQIKLITDAWDAATEAAEKAAKATVTDTTDSYKYYDEATSKVATFIAEHLDKSKKPDSLGALNKKLSEWTGGYILSPEEQIELANLLGVEGIHTNVDEFTQEDRKKILEVLEKLELTWSKKKHTVSYTPKGYATGGIIDTKDILKRSGEQGFIIANNGEAVLTNPQWKLLREFADGLNNIKIQTPKIPDIQPRNMQSPVYHIDNSVTVDGVATDQIVKDMEKVAQKQAENTIAKINSLTYSKGVRYK